jgi:hypothetical protein
VVAPVNLGGTVKSKGKKYDEDDDDDNRIKAKEDKLTVQPTPFFRQERPPADPPTMNPNTTEALTPSTAPASAPKVAAPSTNPIPVLGPRSGVPNPKPNGVPVLPAPSRMPQPKTPVQPTTDGSMPQDSAPASGGSTPGSPTVAPVSPPTTTGTVPTGGSVPSSTLSPSLQSDQTATTTGPPTVAPVLEIIGTALRTISSDPVFLRIRGDFDPIEEEDIFYRNLEQLLGPYSRANVGSRLEEIQLRVDFITETPSAGSATTTTTKRQKTVETTVWTEVVVVYLISGDSFFSTTMGTDYLRQFFAADNKQRLISQLRNEGIAITSLDAVEELPESLYVDDDNVLKPTVNGETTDKDLPGSEQDDPAPERSRKSRSSAIVAAVLSAVIVLCALGAIVVANRRRRLHRITMGVYDAQLNAPDKDDDNTPRRQGNDHRVRTTVFSDDSSISSFHSKKERNLKATTAESQSQNQGTDNDAALSDPDGDQSFCAMHNEYSEPDQDPPQSPVWSVGNYSTLSTPYSVEEDCVVARRRWHQANDPDYIGLPDHHSVGGYEHSKYEASDDESFKAASIA